MVQKCGAWCCRCCMTQLEHRAASDAQGTQCTVKTVHGTAGCAQNKRYTSQRQYGMLRVVRDAPGSTQSMACMALQVVQSPVGSARGCRQHGVQPCVTLRAVHSAGGALLPTVHSAGLRSADKVVQRTSTAQCCRWSMSLQEVQGMKGGGARCCGQCTVLQQRTAPRAVCSAPGDAPCRRCMVLQVAHGTGSAGHKAAGCEVLLVVQGAAQAVRRAGSGQCRTWAVQGAAGSARGRR